MTKYLLLLRNSLLVALLLPCYEAISADLVQGPDLKLGWSEPALSVFTSGCTEAIVLPAKEQYAAAAARAGNSSPKPFPEEQFRASAQPMCACLVHRLATTWDVSEVAANEQAMKSLLDEANVWW
ncbi:MAG: hypothetical protein M0P42_12470 [Gallionella sp.]|jgi:hypothetical protein|nr:hypothetical protein [Gallionella sp.]